MRCFNCNINWETVNEAEVERILKEGKKDLEKDGSRMEKRNSEMNIKLEEKEMKRIELEKRVLEAEKAREVAKAKYEELKRNKT